MTKHWFAVGVKIAGSVLFIGLLTACGEGVFETESSLFSVEMQGVFIAPQDAVGSQDPIQQSFEIVDIQFVSSEREETVSVYDLEPAVIRVVSRPQIVFESDIKDLEGMSFTEVHLTLAESVLTQTTSGQELEGQLPDPVLVFHQPFSLQKKSLKLRIDVQWKDTVYRDLDGVLAATPPAFSMSLK